MPNSKLFRFEKLVLEILFRFRNGYLISSLKFNFELEILIRFFSLISKSNLKLEINHGPESPGSILKALIGARTHKVLKSGKKSLFFRF